MRLLKGVMGILAGLTLLALASGEALADTFVGTIKSIKVEECGIAPGSCRGSAVLTKGDGVEATVQIDFASRLYKKIKDGDRYTLGALVITQLREGEKVKVDVLARKDGAWNVVNLVVQ
ncbi:MAG: hypothetical protein HYS14_03785 [Candidatus Rokubacteria bacterium]|nr:hypothetical protein [Candidatus Rokubacteria bacterium]